MAQAAPERRAQQIHQLCLGRFAEGVASQPLVVESAPSRNGHVSLRSTETPAYKCYPPAPCDINIPLDFTNPDLVAFQITNGVLPAKAQGYNGIAWDNFDLGNSMKACGHFSKAGDWVQQYAGTNTTITPEGKDGWAQDVMAWTA